MLPRVQSFGWLVLHDRLLTSSAVSRKGLCSTGVCTLCAMAEETLIHALRDCDFAMNVWWQLGAVKRDIYIFAHGVQDWLAINLKSTQMFTVDDDQNSLDWNVVFLVACWLIWRWSRKRLFEAWLLSSSSVC